MDTMRVVFAGSPPVARTVLEALVKAGVNIVGVITQPDRPVGRKQIVTPTAVSQVAGEMGLPTETPANADALVDSLNRLQPDLVIAVAYGRLLTRAHLNIPPLGWWNLHFSLLPAWRGATPVQHALLAGDKTTGVTVFHIDEGLDTGPVLNQRAVPIEPFVDAGALLNQLAELGAAVLVETLGALQDGTLTPTPQQGTPSHAPKLTREDGRLDFGQPAAEVFRRWQAVTPEPGAFTSLVGREGGLRVLHARPSPDVVDLAPGEVAQRGGRVFVGCGRGALELLRVQPAGKRDMPAMDWWRGAGEGAHCG